MTAPWNGRPPAPLDQAARWHWLRSTSASIPCEWRPHAGCWHIWSQILPAESVVAFGWQYVERCIPPDQIAAQIAEAVKAEREAIATVCELMGLPSATNLAPMTPVRHGYLQGVSDCVSVIRSRGETA